MDTMNFENVLSIDEMSLTKGGDWILTEDGWIWINDQKKSNDDDWDL